MVLEARNVAQSQSLVPWLEQEREHFKAKVVALPSAKTCRRRRSTNSLIVRTVTRSKCKF